MDLPQTCHGICRYRNESPDLGTVLLACQHPVPLTYHRQGLLLSWHRRVRRRVHDCCGDRCP